MIRLRLAEGSYPEGMRIERIRGITFDAGGTLIAPEPNVGAIYAVVAARHGLAADAAILEARFRVAFARRSAGAAGPTSEAIEKAFWKALVREVFEDVADAGLAGRLFPELWDTFAEARRWRPLPNAANVIRELRRRGYTVAILSNWDSRLHTVIAGLGWTEWLDGVFISADVGFAKPDRAIFDHAAAALGLRPDELMHVGDSAAADAAGAIGAGWRSALLGGGHPDAISINGLGDLLQRLR